MLYLFPAIILFYSALFTFFDFEFSVYILIGIYLFFSTSFYYLVLTVFIGLKSVVLFNNKSAQAIWQNRIIEILGAAVIFTGGYQQVFYYILPYIVISTGIDTMNSLVTAGILEFKSYDSEDDDQ